MISFLAMTMRDEKKGGKKMHTKGKRRKRKMETRRLEVEVRSDAYQFILNGWNFEREENGVMIFSKTFIEEVK